MVVSRGISMAYQHGASADTNPQGTVREALKQRDENVGYYNALDRGNCPIAGDMP